MKTNRFALRILQNRTGLVPRPSWCTYRLRPSSPGQAMMDLDSIRRTFERLGELDLVRFSGPEPLVREDLEAVAEVILETSRPSILHLNTDGQDPERAERFAGALSTPEVLRVLVEVPRLPVREAPLEEHRRFVLALDTLKRLRNLARARGFKLGGLCHLDRGVSDGELKRIRDSLEDLGIDLYTTLDGVGPGLRPAGGRPDIQRLANIALAESEARSGGLVRVGERYFLRGAIERMAGSRSPKPSPTCTSLRSHVRVESDGRVPTCGFRPEVIGHLPSASFESVWFGDEAEKARVIVDECPGCWSAEDTLPSALYNGDFAQRRRSGRSRDLSRREGRIVVGGQHG